MKKFIINLLLILLCFSLLDLYNKISYCKVIHGLNYIVKLKFITPETNQTINSEEVREILIKRCAYFNIQPIPTINFSEGFIILKLPYLKNLNDVLDFICREGKFEIGEGIYDKTTKKIIKKVYLDNSHVKFAASLFESLFPEIHVVFNAEGRNLFFKLTKKKIGQRISFFFDDNKYSVTTGIQSAISTGTCLVYFVNPEECSKYGYLLNIKKLPCPLKVISIKE